MNYPTDEELRVALDEITADGRGAAVTVMLCRLVVFTPAMRDTVDATATILESELLKDMGKPERLAFVSSVLAKGLNLGIRIGERRIAALGDVRPRQAIENLLAHFQDGCSHTTPECGAQVVNVLQWVLKRSASHEA